MFFFIYQYIGSVSSNGIRSSSSAMEEGDFKKVPVAPPPVSNGANPSPHCRPQQFPDHRVIYTLLSGGQNERNGRQPFRRTRYFFRVLFSFLYFRGIYDGVHWMLNRNRVSPVVLSSLMYTNIFIRWFEQWWRRTFYICKPISYYYWTFKTRIMYKNKSLSLFRGTYSANNLCHYVQIIVHFFISYLPDKNWASCALLTFHHNKFQNYFRITIVFFFFYKRRRMYA